MHPVPPAARGHLRLAGPPAEQRKRDSRILLLLRAAAAAAALVLTTLVALTFATLALVPLVLRRAPVGVRLRPLRPREARVIPFQRQKAMPR